MSLRSQIETDLAFIMEDDATGFGWSFSLTSPAGVTASLTGLTDDISQIIDPETGMVVSGRSASVAIRTSSILSALPGAGLPRSISDRNTKPWLVRFDDIHGTPHVFKVARSDPDRTFGVLVLFLEGYDE